MLNGTTTGKVTRSDYAANAGDQATNQQDGGPGYNGGALASYNFPPKPDPVAVAATGVSFRSSQIRIKDITDGTTYTYMVGEKFVATNLYPTGTDEADNEWAFCGYDNDIYRTAIAFGGGANARQDQNSDTGDPTDKNGTNMWGSAHSNTFNMLFCDGSVHQVPYNIDLKTHQLLANRKDGKKFKIDF
jgi:prepilin-type processing-associated H-X9-DG protein